jgi:hypothetical protein
MVSLPSGRRTGGLELSTKSNIARESFLGPPVVVVVSRRKIAHRTDGILILVDTILCRGQGSGTQKIGTKPGSITVARIPKSEARLGVAFG